MDIPLQLLSGLSPIVQILVVIAVIIYRKEIALWLNGEGGDRNPILEDLLSQMRVLTLHFNHETTDGQRQIIDGIGDMKEKQSETNALLHEFKDYGIRMRPHDVNS